MAQSRPSVRTSILSLFAIAVVATSSAASASDEFYDNAFRRGVAAFDAGTYDVAMSRLRIAAFGFLDDPERFETAQAYIAVAAQRLDQPDVAAIALRRIIGAERLERHFATLALSPAMRTAIEAAAKSLLPEQQAGALLNPPAQPQIAAPKPTAPPKTQP